MKNRKKTPNINNQNDVYRRRNELLIKFFKLIDVPVRLIGKPSKPFIIYNEEALLNAYVYNFELRFTDSPNHTNIIYTVNLSENPKFDKNMVLGCISGHKSRAIFKAYLENTNPKLYLTGYNYLNKKEKLGRYPVFSAYNSIIYFSEENIKEIISDLIKDGYDVKYE